MIHETKGEYSIFINSASREKLGGTEENTCTVN